MSETLQKRSNKRKKRLIAVLLAVTLFLCLVFGVLELGVWYTKTQWEHWYPSYAKENIEPLLEKSELTGEDYRTIYEQTGLTKRGVDDLLAEGKGDRILQIQEGFFVRPIMTADHFSAFTYIEETDFYMPMTALKTGDILVSASTRVSWFRYGHAALVVDGESELILEAICPGTKSRYGGANSFSYFVNFLVLRPKFDEQTKAEIARYARQNMVGLPYGLTTGIFSKKEQETLTRTQCAHLVWYAYKKFGIDLDSNGGLIVKPQDMALSPHVEVVQSYGFNLDTLWA